MAKSPSFAPLSARCSSDSARVRGGNGNAFSLCRQILAADFHGAAARPSQV